MVRWPISARGSLHEMIDGEGEGKENSGKEMEIVAKTAARGGKP